MAKTRLLLNTSAVIELIKVHESHPNLLEDGRVVTEVSEAKGNSFERRSNYVNGQQIVARTFGSLDIIYTDRRGLRHQEGARSGSSRTDKEW